MKLITLNTHSLIEEHYEEKLHAFAEVIRKEKPDILAMQEVNQLACEEIWPDEKLPGFVRCRGFSLPVRRGNHAARLAELLKDSGLSYSWTWISAKMGYDRYDEGMAVFSLSPIADTDQFQISRSSDYHYWKTRRVLGIRTEADPDTWFYTVHMGWWDDAEDPFAGQWEQLNQFLQEKGRLDSGKNVWLLGDFNSPSAVSGEGYDCIRKAGWLDSYVLAARKDDGATVDHVIDGWRDKMAEGESCRLDYMFSRNPVRIRSSRVICNGTLYPVVSDHFGVMVVVSA